MLTVNIPLHILYRVPLEYVLDKASKLYNNSTDVSGFIPGIGWARLSVSWGFLGVLAPDTNVLFFFKKVLSTAG